MDALFGCLGIDDAECPVRGRLHPLHWPKAIWNIVGCAMSHPSGAGSSQMQQRSKKVFLNMSKRVKDSMGNPKLISTLLSF